MPVAKVSPFLAIGAALMTSTGQRPTQPHETIPHRANLRRPLLVPTVLVPGLLACLCLTSSGCTTLIGRPTPAGLAEQAAETPHSIQLTYHTDSARLNQLAAGRHESPQAGSSQAGDEQAAMALIPSFTTSTLTIEYPHPEGVPGHARVTARFESGSFDARSGTLWRAISGEEVSEAPQRPHFREEWQDDIQDWQLASLIAQLHGKGFFRRINVIGSGAHIATNINGDQTAKDFPAVAELDQLLMTIRRKGQPFDPVTEGNSPEVAQIEPPLPLLE